MALAAGIELFGTLGPRHDEILTPEALAFVATLHRNFDRRRLELLDRRRARQAELDAGARLDFLADTKAVRDGNWTCAPLPKDLLDRRVEITGPVDRKMVINALNSGANVFMADFEDANAPTFRNLLDGQVNLFDAVRRVINFVDSEKQKTYALNDKTAVLFVRPRGWHLPEKHLRVDGEVMSGALFDFGLFFFHNAKEQVQRGSGPYFYLPKLQSHLEARLWNDVFAHAQRTLGLAEGTVKATVLIETLPAAFEMDEILNELRQHSAGLNCGRWDYIFSFIKTQRNNPAALLPDRAQVTMEQPFMRAYTQLVVKTCHRRGVHAMGGMAAQIPIKNDDAANSAALDKVRKDKAREVRDGHDGTWVAHPGLVPIAKEIFDAEMTTPNQISRQRDDVEAHAEALLAVPTGTRTMAGLVQNVSVGIAYLAAWLEGSGCVPLHNLMEDAATAEISRSQLWQWLRHQATLADGTVVSRELIQKVVEDELHAVQERLGPERFEREAWGKARRLFVQLVVADTLEDFLTLPAYDHLVEARAKQA